MKDRVYTHPAEPARPAPHVITQREAEFALDREEFDRLMEKWGTEEIILWWHETTLNLARRGYSAVSPGTAGDPRR